MLKPSKLKLIIFFLMVIGSVSIVDPIWSKSPQTTVGDYFIELTTTPWLTEGIILLGVLLVNYNLLEGNSVLFKLRYGNIRSYLNKVLEYDVIFSLLLSLVIFNASLIIGSIKNYQLSFKLTAPLFKSNNIVWITKIWELFLFILAYLLFLTLLYFLEENTLVVFSGGLILIFILLGVYKTVPTLLIRYPVLIGQELFIPTYQMQQWHFLVPYLSLIWIVIELVIIEIWVKR